ncbi:unnamed protein product [Arctogadus glacialis]
MRHGHGLRAFGEKPGHRDPKTRDPERLRPQDPEGQRPETPRHQRDPKTPRDRDPRPQDPERPELRTSSGF